jgi:hypothetical protein
MAAINAVPPTLDLNLYAGDDVAMTLTITDDAGNPYDVTGTLLAQVRKGHALDVVATLVAVAVTPTLGVISLSIDGATTEALGNGGGRHSWDLQLTTGTGIVTTLVKGTVSTTLDITHTDAPLVQLIKGAV